MHSRLLVNLPGWDLLVFELLVEPMHLISLNQRPGVETGI